MDAAWERLYNEAKKVLAPRRISEWMEAGGVAAAIESSTGKIYTGICVDGACTLGICAERNAIFHIADIISQILAGIDRPCFLTSV